MTYIQKIFEAFQLDPSSVSDAWRRYFEDDAFRNDQRTIQASATNDELLLSSVQPIKVDPVLQDRVDQLVRAYRVRGHIIAKINPLGVEPEDHGELNLDAYGLTEDDLGQEVSCRTIAGPATQSLKKLIERLRNTYCRSIGVQFMHIDDLNVRHWLQERMEGSENRITLPRRQQLRILTSLTRAVVFEEFLQKKYVGAKTFSLEGCETLIPLLDIAIDSAADYGVKEIVIGMAHRGRLNVLANIIGKRPIDIFSEFEDKPSGNKNPRGDVQYHLGHSNDWETSSGHSVHLSLCFNPSHLEFINPVAMGRMRAKQDRLNRSRQSGLVILIHGDAAFAGEGIVQESLNLSRLDGYSTGGALHVIVNNQLGFTTPPQQGRSGLYATAVAKMLQIPIFHVNGEDPEAVVQVIQLATDFRYEFGQDVIVDMYGYRRHGHNEMDEPTFTQPLLYKAIENRKSVRDGYLDHLLHLGEVTKDEADGIAELFENRLRDDLEAARKQEGEIENKDNDGMLRGVWRGYVGEAAQDNEQAETSMPWKRLSAILRRSVRVPVGFNRHRKLERFAKQREKMAKGETPVDWATAESLALGSLALEGIRVRLTGQDSERGTFGQRHAVLHDTETGEKFAPLNHLGPDQAPVEIINSPLSEAGALGFEYGFSLDFPDGLVLWEAQYGDFVNAAQVIIDQFIVSAEEKWNRLSGLVLLLPHGYEGRGPEHSSARIERFLQLAALDNIQVAYPTTAAQYFHLLRRQAIRRWRKPLVVFTPKSLLRKKEVASESAEFENGSFSKVIGDDKIDGDNINRVLLCSGKIYFELDEARRENELENVAIIRLEQLYPLRTEDFEPAFGVIPDETPVFWVQEEPRNMGPWPYIHDRFERRLLGSFPLDVISRPAASAPASGTKAMYESLQNRIIQTALGLEADSDRNDVKVQPEMIESE